MSSGTITSLFHMRKRRFQEPMEEAIKPKCKQITKVIPSPSRSKSKSPSQVARSPKVRQSVKSTSMKFLCSQSDSQPEISWDCNSPEFHKPRRRIQESDSDNNDDTLSLIQRIFNSSPPVKKKEEKPNSLMALWLAPTEVNASKFTKKTQSTPSSWRKTEAPKPSLAKEFEELITEVNKNEGFATKSVNGPKCQEVISTLPSTSSGVHRQTLAMKKNVDTNNKRTINLDKGTAGQKTVAKTDSDSNSSVTWSDEDMFNEEGFIEQTQKIMDTHVAMNNSQAPTQKVIITDDSSGSDDGLQNKPVVNPSYPLRHKTTGSKPTALKDTAAIPVAKSVDKFWDSDDGIDEIMCTMDDSLDYLMNCDTQPYPVTRKVPSPPIYDLTQLTPSEVLIETVPKPLSDEKPGAGMPTSPWKFTPVPAKGSRNTVQPPSKQLLGPTASQNMPTGSSRPCTLEEIERKRQEAIERRRKKIQEAKSSTKSDVRFSQIMPENIKESRFIYMS